MMREEYLSDNAPGSIEFDAVSDDPENPGAIIYYLDNEEGRSLRIKFANGVIKVIAEESISL